VVVGYNWPALGGKNLVSGRTGGIMIIVSLFLPWWTFFLISGAGSAFAGVWLFGGWIYGGGLSIGGFTSELAVAAALVIVSGALGIISTRDRKFSLVGGALGLLGALVFLLKLSDVSGGLAIGSVFFGAQSAAGDSAFWFLSFGFWLAIASSIIMLLAKPTIPEVRAPPAVPAAAPPPAERAPPEVPAAKVQYCSNCGAPLEPGAKFCTSCGTSIGKRKRKKVKKKRVVRKRIKKRRAAKRKRPKRKAKSRR